MYARVARWEGGDAEAIKSNVEEIKARVDEGPPERVPAKGITFLVDADGGRVISISLFESEEDLRAGDEALNSMSPPNPMGTRAGVETYEVAIDRRL